jgi:hypothetical protein
MNWDEEGKDIPNSSETREIEGFLCNVDVMIRGRKNKRKFFHCKNLAPRILIGKQKGLRII